MSVLPSPMEIEYTLMHYLSVYNDHTSIFKLFMNSELLKAVPYNNEFSQCF